MFLLHIIKCSLSLFSLQVTTNDCRFCTTGLPSDIVVEVGEMSFHLHKVDLLTKFSYSILRRSSFVFTEFYIYYDAFINICWKGNLLGERLPKILSNKTFF